MSLSYCSKKYVRILPASRTAVRLTKQKQTKHRYCTFSWPSATNRNKYHSTQNSYGLCKATETFSAWNTLFTLLFSLYYFSFEKAAGKFTDFRRQTLLVTQEKWPRWYCSTTWSLRRALQSGHNDNHTEPPILLVWFPCLGTSHCYCVLAIWFNQPPLSKY